eukprot:482564-Rhodomonas_salina.1
MTSTPVSFARLPSCKRATRRVFPANARRDAVSNADFGAASHRVALRSPRRGARCWSLALAHGIVHSPAK